MFESGAILMYLGRKTGKFYPKRRARDAWRSMQWLMWQMGGFGPMLGQTHHFRIYAPEKIEYAMATATLNEAQPPVWRAEQAPRGPRLRLPATTRSPTWPCIGWAKLWERQGQDIAQFPNVKAWIDRMLARPAVQKGLSVNKDDRNAPRDAAAQAILFGQKAR